MAQREDIIRRTVYVSDIDQQVCKKLPPFFNGSLPQTYAILIFFGFRSLRSSLIVCSSALGRSKSLLQVHLCLFVVSSLS